MGRNIYTKITSLLIVLLFLGSAVQAQIVVIGATSGVNSYFYGPIYRSSAASVFNYSRYAHLYTAAELGIPAGSIITQVEWLKANSGTLTGSNTFNVLMDNSVATTLTSGTTWSALTATATSVYSSSTQAFTGPINTYESYTLMTPFIYTGGSLVIFEDHVKTGTASGVLNYYYNTATNKALGFSSNVAPTGSTTLTTATYGNNRPTIRITYTAATPCSGTPTGGTTVSSSNPVCSGTSFTLSASGATSATGLTYQWQSSPDGSTWSDISGATSSTLATTQTVASYYRRNMTCTSSGGSATSTPLLVTMNSGIVCYCTATATSTIDEEIYSVTLNGSSTNATYANANGCINVAPGPGSVLSLYSNFTTLGSLTSIMQGSTVALSIFENECDAGTFYSNGIAVFIDWNQDGDWVDAGEMVYNDGAATTVGPKTVGGSITVPITATTGTTFMRVICGEGFAGTTITPCLSPTYGEVEDYQITVTASTACSGTPAGGTTTSSANPVCSGVNFDLGTTGSTIASGLTYQWQSSPDGSAWSNISGATSATYTTNQSTATWYRRIITCTASGGSASSTPLNVTMNTLFSCYCTAGMTFGGDEDLTNISLGTINNTTGCGSLTGSQGTATGVADMYSNFTSSAVPIPNLFQGSSYTLSVTITECLGTAYTHQCMAYIDFNGNGLLTDAGEAFTVWAYASSNTHTATVSIPVPMSAALGNTLMRIIVNEGTVTGPCMTGSWGEVEDYRVNIAATVACSGTPTGGTTTSSANPVCSGVNFTLGLTGSTLATGLTYQWQSSPDGSTWSDISGATTNSLITSQSSATWYRNVVTCTSSGGSATSTPLNVTMSAPTACYCAAGATTCDEYVGNVTLSTINNSTTCTAGGYANYTGMSTNLTQGASYSMSVSNPLHYAGDQLGVWIDWNQDGDFYDSGEQQPVSYAACGGSPCVSTGTITVPCSALIGTTRMRVRIAYTGILDPCGTAAYGEVEDYTVNVTAAPANDAGVTAISSFCNGLQPVSVTIKNYGSATLNSVTVNWSVNAIPQAPITLTGLSIPSCSTSVQVIGTYTFSTGAYTIAANTTNPNGLFDGNVANDAFTMTSSSSLSGNYNVGTGGDFTTLTAALASYNANGVCGPTTFYLTNSSYSAGETFPLIITQANGTTATNFLTIKPAPGVTAIITSSDPTATFEMNGTDYVVIDGSNSAGGTSRDLTFESLAGTSFVFWMNNGTGSNSADNNTIKNCKFQGAAGTTTLVGFGESGTTTGTAVVTANSNNTLQNNLFIKTQNGIYLYGGATRDQNWTVTGNVVGSTVTAEKFGYRCGLIANLQNSTISGNTFLGSSGAFAYNYGIQVYGDFSAVSITGNTFSDIKNSAAGGAYGIYLQSTNAAAGITVANNMMYDIASTGSATVASNGYGIVGVSGGGYNIYYNTINMNTNQTTGYSAAIYPTAAMTGTMNVRNNIFANNQTSGAQRYAIYSDAASTAFSTINYNDYSVASGGTLGYIGATNRTTLAQIQAGFGGNVNSTTATPVFVSASNLHLVTDANCAMDGAATPIVAVTNDIDLAARSLTVPDIGADEFTSTFLVDAGPNQNICATGTISLAGTTVPTGGTGLWTVGAGSGAFTDATASNPTVSGYTSGGFTNIYNWAVVSGSCNSNDNVNVTVTDGPSISINPADQQVCAGTPFSLSVTASNAGGYQWYQGVTPISSSNPYSVGAAVPGDAGNYYVEVSGTGACSGVTATSSTATVTVNGSGQWLGGTSSNWHDATNWCGGVPGTATDVMIPVSAPNQPLISVSPNAFAHNITFSGGTLTVSSGSTLSIYGDIILSPSGTLNSGSGDIYFEGTGTQTVPAGILTSVNGLGATSGGNKMLGDDLTVNGYLNLNGGSKVVLGNNVDLTLANTVTGVTASASSYVKTTGTASYLVREVGAGPVTFPVGNTNFNPVTMNNTGTTDNFRLHVRDEVLVSGTTGMQVDNTTTYVINHTFDIEEDVLGGSLANITIQWGAGEENTGLFQYNHAYIAHFYDNDGAGPNPAEWHHDDIPYSSMAPAAGGWPGAGPYTATTSNVTTFSPFAIGSNGGSAPLHVQLTDVSAVNEGAKNKVEWHSAVEDGLDHYEVERSTDGQNFSHMADVAASGHAFGYLTYDNSPNPGLTYYRLKLVEQDGSSTYSQIVHAFMKVGNDVVVSVYPNPVTDVLHIEVFGSTDDATVTLTDLSGKVIAPVTLHNGQAEINMSSLSSGVYFVKFSGNGLSKTIKVDKN